MKKLTLTGSAKEIGYQHGYEGKDEVHQSLQTYEKLFYGYKKMNWQAAKEIALTHMDAIEKYNPAFIEEMDGAAEGAGVDFEDILVLNTRSEIALTTTSEGPAFSDGCTSIGITSPITDQTMIGQNWDWKASQTKSLLLLHIEQENLPSIKMVTEGGIIGKIGMNSAGMGVCFNALLTDQKSNQVPVHLGLRSVLNAYTLEEAISRIHDGQMASCANFLIGSDDGSGNGLAMNVEVSPFGIDLLGGETGKVVHTNHLCSKKIQQNVTDLNTFKQTDSLLRYKRAEQLINEKQYRKAPINEETMKTWFADTFNAPNSINHFENKRAPEHRQIETVFSIVMNLTERHASVCVGKPAETAFHHI
ncbi:C45 family peptidase [Alteribacillus sp. YIM 98480]|uniref:C45 family autoproteolytic acyltransferase/hydolase n=1 Tax=Alteribacillus sp. YIM 98480 TaxID=2606599 RepID=UPI00131CA543|nr:C45 family peptidase [Alteribacillus sp. YIM 98480]